MRTGSSTVGEYGTRTRRAGGCCYRRKQRNWSRDRRCTHRSRSVGGGRCPHNVPDASRRDDATSTRRRSRSRRAPRRDQARLVERAGDRLDVSLVNNVGSAPARPEGVPVGHGRAVAGHVRTGVLPVAVRNARAAIPAMLGAGRAGVIVNVCSVNSQARRPQRRRLRGGQGGTGQLLEVPSKEVRSPLKASASTR